MAEQIGPGHKVKVTVPGWKVLYGEVLQVLGMTYLVQIDGDQDPTYFVHGWVEKQDD